MDIENKEHFDHNKFHESEIKILDKISELEKRLLSQEELTGLRSLMAQDARIRWFWSSLRTWVLVISSTIALLTVGFEGLKTLLRRLVA